MNALHLYRRETLAHEGCRHQVGNRELRIVGVGWATLVGFRLAHGLDDLRRHQRLDALDVANRELVLLGEGQRRVGAGMREMAGGQRLDGDGHRLPDLAQASRRPAPALGLDAGLQVGVEEAEPPLIGP